MAVYDDSNLFVDRNGKINANTGDTDSSGLNAVDVSGSTVRSGNHAGGAEDGESADQEKTGSLWPERPNASGSGVDPNGGDGYDNLGLRVEGKRNIAAYDDSNIVAGGTGRVNAQIGDSDTSGAVVMGINNSKLQAGAST